MFQQTADKFKAIPWIVRYYCPYCHETDELIIYAESQTKARSKAVGTPLTCTRCLRSFILKSEYIIGVYPLKTEKPPKIVREAPTIIVSAKRFPDNTVSVTLQQGDYKRSITFPAYEVQIYDKLMREAPIGERTYKNALIAHLIAHGATTKSLATGFLNANKIQVNADTIGEALSRLPYVYTATEPIKIHPLPRTSTAKQILTAAEIFEKPPRETEAAKRQATFMGETIYYMPETTRTRIIERSKLYPFYMWWSYEELKPTPPVAPTKVEYEWVKITAKTPRTRSAEDFKHYGPYNKGDMAKLPLALAYFLIRTGYAEWLNPTKELALRAEELFRFLPTEKLRRQATLIEF